MNPLFLIIRAPPEDMFFPDATHSAVEEAPVERLAHRSVLD